MSKYQSRHSIPGEEPQKSKAPVIIIVVILVLAMLAGGAYALMHFGIIPNIFEQATEAPTEAPTQAPTLAPTETPTEAPTEADYAALAEQTMSSMSVHDKICQLFIVTPETLTGVDGVNMAGETTKQAIADYPVGGIIYNTGNLESKEQTAEMLSKSQSFSKIPMFLSVDEEGGNVARVAEKLGTTKLDPMLTYKDAGEQKAHDNAQTIAKDISALGFNLDFAPVADTLTNSANTVIGSRAYSDNYEEAAKLVASAVKGFADGGVLSTVKHFPGHGGTDEDSHNGLAYVSSSADELKAGALLPFKSGIDAGADMVMIGHLVVSSIDEELPATLSSKVVPQLLREYMGYDGVVITDGMQMAAITDNYSREAIVKGIFDADIDMILEPDDLGAYISAIETALENGTITEAQLNAKVKRILTLKYKKGVIPAATSNASPQTPTENAQPLVTAMPETTAVTKPAA